MSNRTVLIIVTLATITFTLAGCGSSRTDRALSGAGIGAGVGAVGSTLAGGSTVGGAVLGGAAGAAIGAVTDKDDINFGH